LDQTYVAPRVWRGNHYQGDVATTSQIVGPASVGASRREHLVLVAGIAPLVLLAVISIVTFVDGLNPGSVGFDFRGAYLRAADEILEGESPYPPVEGFELASQSAYVYPPLLAFALIPVTVIPVGLASALAAVATGVILLSTLVLLGVRDWRCYAAALLWAPTTNALHMASASALVALSAALAWRYRGTVLPLAAAVGLGLATKLILWPLLVWGAVTRRLRAVALAALIAGGVTLALWAILGFDGLERYPSVLRRLAELEAEESYSLVGAFAALGAGETVARTMAVAITVGLLALCVAYARRGDERRSFIVALAAALAFSPIVWLHYLVLLLVPLAIARPRFSAVWLLPLLLWLTPLNGNGELIQPLLPALVAAAVIGLCLVQPETQREPRALVAPRAPAAAGSP
jgi:alpha-1,2-mannosyltransferase